MYLLGTPMRRRARRAAEAEADALQQNTDSGAQPDGSRHASGDAVAPERKEA
jgi:hypothetical protein